MRKEEVVLYITKLEPAISEGTPKPHGCFASVANPIAMMTQEHDAAGTLLAEMRELSGGFVPPVGACPTYHAFYNGLREFERDLHQHIHLETIYSSLARLPWTLQQTKSSRPV